MIIHDRNVRQLSWLPLPSSLTTGCCLRTAHCWPHCRPSLEERKNLNLNVSNVHTCSLICLVICFSVEIVVIDYRRCAAVKTTLDKIYGWPIYTQGTAGQQRQLLSLLNWRSKHALPSTGRRTPIGSKQPNASWQHFISLTISSISQKRNNIKRKWRSSVWRAPGCPLKKINLIHAVR